MAEYYVSLPTNKLELWMALESARFLSPVFRELYSEKEVRRWHMCAPTLKLSALKKCCLAIHSHRFLSP